LALVEKECLAILSQTQSRSYKSSIQALLAIVHLQNGINEDSRTLLETACCDRDTMDPSALADLGGGFMLLGEPETALQYLELAILKEPLLAIAHGRAGMALMKMGRLVEAKKALELARNLEPNLTAFAVNLASISLLMGELDAALYELNKSPAIKTNPSPFAIKIRVEALLGLGRLEEANKIAIDVLQGAGGEKPDGLTLYTLVLAANNRHDEAQSYLRKALEKFPENLEILGQLSELSLVQGRFGEAIKYLGICLKQDPDNSSLWARFSIACTPNFSLKAAMEAALKAVALTKDKTGFYRAQAITALALAHNAEDNYTQAEHFFLQALNEVEDFPQAHLGFGHMLLRLGRIDEAIVHFEAVKERNPVVGFAALTTAGRFPDDPAILTKIEKAARMPSLQGPVLSNLMFNLAVAWEKRDCYDKAFKFAIEANRVTHPFLPYNGEAHRQYIDEIMGVFSKEFFTQRTAFGNPSKLPIFILGMPRSGTTLVEQILASHPEIFGAGELGQIPSVIATLSAWECHIGSGQDYPKCIVELSCTESQKMAQPLLY
jgi:tetratricopeptide (TPR) repeat protein